MINKSRGGDVLLLRWWCCARTYTGKEVCLGRSYWLTVGQLGKLDLRHQSLAQAKLGKTKTIHTIMHTSLTACIFINNGQTKVSLINMEVSIVAVRELLWRRPRRRFLIVSLQAANAQKSNRIRTEKRQLEPVLSETSRSVRVVSGCTVGQYRLSKNHHSLDACSWMPMFSWRRGTLRTWKGKKGGLRYTWHYSRAQWPRHGNSLTCRERQKLSLFVDELIARA